MRCTQFYPDPEINRRFLNAIDSYQKTGTKVDDYEETEQVFSRKDRKAYRQLWDREAIKQRTEAKRGNKGREAQALGKEGSPKAKTTRTARTH